MRGYVKNFPQAFKTVADEEYSWAVDLPDSIDRRTLGEVNPVQDQADCGSCWAFATIAAVESAYKRSSGDLVKLSEQ